MKDYIERAAAIDICQKEYEDRLRMFDYCGDTVAWNIGGSIKSIQTADVVEVVRCGQCRYSGPASKLSQKYGATGVLTCHGPLCNRRNVTETDFCSRGALMDGKEGA